MRTHPRYVFKAITVSERLVFDPRMRPHSLSMLISTAIWTQKNLALPKVALVPLEMAQGKGLRQRTTYKAGRQRSEHRFPHFQDM